MRLRFMIRDLLWLTLVVAMAVGWWVDRRAMTNRLDDLNWERGNLLIQNVEMQHKLGTLNGPYERPPAPPE